MESSVSSLAVRSSDSMVSENYGEPLFMQGSSDLEPYSPPSTPNAAPAQPSQSPTPDQAARLRTLLASHLIGNSNAPSGGTDNRSLEELLDVLYSMTVPAGEAAAKTEPISAPPVASGAEVSGTANTEASVVAHAAEPMLANVVEPLLTDATPSTPVNAAAPAASVSTEEAASAGEADPISAVDAAVPVATSVSEFIPVTEALLEDKLEEAEMQTAPMVAHEDSHQVAAIADTAAMESAAPDVVAMDAAAPSVESSDVIAQEPAAHEPVSHELASHELASHASAAQEAVTQDAVAHPFAASDSDTQKAVSDHAQVSQPEVEAIAPPSSQPEEELSAPASLVDSAVASALPEAEVAAEMRHEDKTEEAPTEVQAFAPVAAPTVEAIASEIPVPAMLAPASMPASHGVMALTSATDTMVFSLVTEKSNTSLHIPVLPNLSLLVLEQRAEEVVIKIHLAR